MTYQYVDPEVSKAKFARQVEAFVLLRSTYEERGWFLIEASFPTLFVLMAVPQLRPCPILTGVVLDYTNYDAEPPSVRLVDPCTRRPYLARELPTLLPRSLPTQTVELVGLPGNLEMQGTQALMQAHSPDEVPFLCVAGTKEYHDHPGHSGDSWVLHRCSGSGAFVRVLEVIYKYGIEPVRDYGVNLIPQVGFAFGPPPS